MVGETNIGGFGFGPNPSPQIYVYRLVGNPRDPAGWERNLVDDHGTHEAQVVDLDGDGYADIAGDEENTELIENPRDGVVNAHGQSHDVPNLFVSDGSQFTSGAAENPTLTIVALAIRQADHIASELAKGNI